MSRLIATFFYVGLLRPAPGTWGSFAAVLIGVPIILTSGVLGLLIGATVTFVIGVWATSHEAGPDDHDPSRVVIDEVSGQWIAMVPVAMLYDFAGDLTIMGLASLASFAFFRAFDVTKPWPVSWADRREDAFGVMLDDTIAGVMAAMALLGSMYVLDILPRGMGFT